MVAESVWQWGKDVQIVYRPKRDNDRADALSRNPVTAQQDDHKLPKLLVPVRKMPVICCKRSRESMLL